MRMAAIGDIIERLLYPPNAVCIACRRLRVDDVHRGLCRDCAQKLAQLAPPVEPGGGVPEPFWAFYCAYPYESVAGALVRALKYRAVADAAVALADGMAQWMDPGAVDALVPVPLHKVRRRTRGFNQAAVLCDALSSRLGTPTLDALVRTRATRTQTRLSREHRQANVHGAFEAALDVQGLSLLLVDDVFTTGATAQACAAVLLQAGALRVCLATATLADGPESDRAAFSLF